MCSHFDFLFPEEHSDFISLLSMIFGIKILYDLFICANAIKFSFTELETSDFNL